MAIKIIVATGLFLGFIGLPIGLLVMWMWELGRPGQWETAWGCLVPWLPSLVLANIFGNVLES